METKQIEKSIVISAPKDKVWEVLFTDQYNRQWFAVFNEGTYAITDWQLGSKAIFIDNSNNGIVGKIIAAKPYDTLSIEYEGMLVNNVEDYESADSKKMKGIRETYILAESEGVTVLSVSCGMDAEWFEHMSQAWDKAMEKIKNLAENN